MAAAVDVVVVVVVVVAAAVAAEVVAAAAGPELGQAPCRVPLVAAVGPQVHCSYPTG